MNTSAVVPVRHGLRAASGWFNSLRHPEGFHGVHSPRPFFEGWYVKVVSADLAQRLAFIPGVFLDRHEQASKAFVQVLDGRTGRSWHHVFPLSDFSASPEAFSVRVGGNQFDRSGAHVDLTSVRGTITYTDPLDPWPVSWCSPGAMGWYGFLPFMESSHDIVSFGHGLAGHIELDSVTHDFDGGRGYIEKDRGSRFPTSYAWVHSNSFREDSGACLSASVAVLPWRGQVRRGFIVGLRHGERLYRWTSYNRSQISKIEGRNSLHLGLTGPDGRLEVTVRPGMTGVLRAPGPGGMHRRVAETLQGQATVTLLSPGGSLTLSTDCAAMEVFGSEVFGDVRALAQRT